MDFKKLNEQLEKYVINENKTAFIQVGSFHDDPETIYFNIKKDLMEEFNQHFDNLDEEELKNRNLLNLSANDEFVAIEQTDYSDLNELKIAIKNGYDYYKNQIEEQGFAELGGSLDDPLIFAYTGGWTIDEEDFPETSEDFVDLMLDYFNNTYIDRDSSSVNCFIDPNTLEIVLGGQVDLCEYDPEDWGNDDEDYDDED